MPKVYVDASVFTKANAFGRISGNIDVPVVPQVGDLIIFGPRGPASSLAVVDHLRVSSRLISANDDLIIIALEDITVERTTTLKS